MASDSPPLDDQVIRAEILLNETGYHVRDRIAEPVPAVEVEDMADNPPLAIILALLMIGLFIWTVMSLRRHHRTTLEAAGRWREWPTLGDGEFLMRCEIPEEPLPVKVALVARKVIAELGTVPPE